MAAVARNVLSVELHRNEPRLYYVIYGPRPRFKCMQSSRAYARPSLSLCIAGCPTFPIFSSLSLSLSVSLLRVICWFLCAPICLRMRNVRAKRDLPRSRSHARLSSASRESSRVVRTCLGSRRFAAGIWNTLRVKMPIVGHSARCLSNFLLAAMCSPRRNFTHLSVHVAGTWFHVIANVENWLGRNVLLDPILDGSSIDVDRKALIKEK